MAKPKDGETKRVAKDWKEPATGILADISPSDCISRNTIRPTSA